MESQREMPSQTTSSGSFDAFIRNDLPIEQIYNVLKLQNKSEEEIDEITTKVKDSRRKIKKVVSKFIEKLDRKYPNLESVGKKLELGLKHADKYGLSDAQKDVFIRHVRMGGVYNHYSYKNEIKDTKMSKFLGIINEYSPMLRIKPKELSLLNELKTLYDATKHLHDSVRDNVYRYTSCSPQAITGKYDKEKHDISSYIHPVVVALFLHKNDAIERKMLLTNIGRLVLSRAQAYLEKPDFHLKPNVTADELDADFELAYDMAKDPNALSILNDVSPMENLLKRFKCQIELYKCVSNLRQGRYYSSIGGHDDGIRGFTDLISEYEWSFFDSPDLYDIQDEGTILRKLLAVFSFRPTITQLSTFTHRINLSNAPIQALAKTKLVNIPIINVKLPIGVMDDVQHTMSLSKALTQADMFIENRNLVPKNKTIFKSSHVAFFYANRRYPTINFTTDKCLTMRTVSLPTTSISNIAINNTILTFDHQMRIARDTFTLKSVVVLDRPIAKGLEFAIKPSTIVISEAGNHDTGVSYWYYSPGSAGIKYLNPNATGDNKYTSNDPISEIPEVSIGENSLGFREEAQNRGTIFFYSIC